MFYQAKIADNRLFINNWEVSNLNHKWKNVIDRRVWKSSPEKMTVTPREVYESPFYKRFTVQVSKYKWGVMHVYYGVQSLYMTYPSVNPIFRSRSLSYILSNNFDLLRKTIEGRISQILSYYPFKTVITDTPSLDNKKYLFLNFQTPGFPHIPFKSLVPRVLDKINPERVIKISPDIVPPVLYISDINPFTPKYICDYLNSRGIESLPIILFSIKKPE